MIVNKKQLADVMGISERTLTEWQESGMPIASIGGRGMENQYDTAVVIEWRVQRAISGAVRETEKARKDRLEGDLLELRIAEKTAGIVPADEVEKIWTTAIMSARAGLRALPDRLKAAIDAEYGVSINIRLPADLVDAALQKLSETVPDVAEDEWPEADDEVEA